MAFRWRQRFWAGIKFKDWGAYFAGHPIVPITQKKPPFWRIDCSEKRVLFSSYHMGWNTLNYYVNELIKLKPAFIQGYPSSLYLLAVYLMKNNVNEIHPKAIIVSSETLFDHQREVIEKAFNSKVFNYYGNAESVAAIGECRYGSLHIWMDYGIVEIINKNGDDAKPGEGGVIIATGLNNKAMPFIRYKTDDIAILSEKRNCPCGCKFPIVDSIIGRVDDCILTPDSRYIGRLDHIFKDVKGVVEAQLIQTRLGSVTLKIIRDDNFTTRDLQKICKKFHNRVGESTSLKIEYVDEIPRLPNGKFKFVISQLYNQPRIYCGS